MTALSNGKSIAHKDIVFNIGGVPFVSMDNLSINQTKNRQFNYGTSEKAISYGDGRYNDAEISFTLDIKEAQALDDVSPEADAKKLPPFDLPVTILGTRPSLWIIKNIMITETNMESDIDTVEGRVTFTAVASHIEKTNL